MKNLLLMFFLFRSNFELNQVRGYREQPWLGASFFVLPAQPKNT